MKNIIAGVFLILLGLIPAFLWKDGTVAVLTTIVGIAIIAGAIQETRWVNERKNK